MRSDLYITDDIFENDNNNKGLSSDLPAVTWMMKVKV